MRRPAAFHFFALAFFIVAEAAPAIGQEDQYGAIAHSASTGAYGWSKDQPTRERAGNLAVQECGRSDCQRGVWFKNACGSLAVGQNRQWGTGWGTSRDLADRYALESCSKVTMNCQIEVTVCVSNPGQDSTGGGLSELFR